MKIITSVERPKGICGIIAAVEGFGKTTLASKLPKPLFIDTDRGTDGMDIPRIVFDGSVGELKGLVRELSETKPGEYRTLVIDTADALEQQLTADFCRTRNWPNMEHRDYGKDWNEWKPEWAAILDSLKDLAKKTGWHVFFTAHVATKEYTDPLRAEKYNRIQLKLAPCTAALLKEWADVYMTGLFKTDVITETVGRKEISHAVDGERECHLEHNEKYDAKCRACLQLPGGKPFPKKLRLDKMAELLPEALEFSTSPMSEGSAPREASPVPRDAGDNAPAPPEEKKSLPAYTARLREAMKQFNIGDDALRGYLKSKGKWGDDIWPVDEIPENVVTWIMGGIDKIAAKIAAR